MAQCYSCPTQAAINSVKTYNFVSKVDFANRSLNKECVNIAFKISKQRRTKETKVNFMTFKQIKKMLNGIYYTSKTTQVQVK
jgi:hypothetical protein